MKTCILHEQLSIFRTIKMKYDPDISEVLFLRFTQTDDVVLKVQKLF